MVNAAIHPLRNSKDLIEGAGQCISNIDKNENMNALDATMAIMSIANDYHEDLETLQQTSDISTIKIEDRMMEYIRIIVVALQQPTVPNMTIPKYSFKKYLLKEKHGSSANGTNGYDKDFKSVMKCFRTIVTMSEAYNKTFFGKLANAFDIERALMRGDSRNNETDQRYNTKIGRIIDEIFEYKLSQVEFNYSEEDVKEILNTYDWLREHE